MAEPPCHYLESSNAGHSRILGPKAPSGVSMRGAVLGLADVVRSPRQDDKVPISDLRRDMIPVLTYGTGLFWVGSSPTSNAPRFTPLYTPSFHRPPLRTQAITIFHTCKR
jgi:hypothetical protein